MTAISCTAILHYGLISRGPFWTGSKLEALRVRKVSSQTPYRLVQAEFNIFFCSKIRKLIEISHTCSVNPCRPVIERYFFLKLIYSPDNWPFLFFPPDIWSLRRDNWPFLFPPPRYLILKEPQILGQTKTKEHLSLAGRQGLMEHVCKITGSISMKRRGLLDFVRKTWVICVVALWLLSFQYGVNFGR